MEVLIVIHVLIALALVGVVLVQRSEGGGLGIGGGGMGGLMSVRGSANVLTRATAVLAAAFMLMSLLLAILAGGRGEPRAIVEDVPAAAGQEAGGQPTPAVPLGE